MPYIKGNPGNLTSAAEIVVSSFEVVSREVLYKEYADIVFPDFIPNESWDTSVAEGADIYSKVIVDKRGVGAFRAVGSNDVPIVGVAQNKISTPLFNGAIGSVIDLQDIARSDLSIQKGFGLDLVRESRDTMRIASDRHIEKVVFFGDTVEDTSGAAYYPGLVNNPNIPTTTVATGAGGGTEWINGTMSKTADEIIYDMEVALNTVYFSTRGKIVPNEIYLPQPQWAYISGLKAGTRANDETVLNFVRLQNVFTTKTGGTPIEIKPLRYLSGAGAGGTDRMMVAAKQPVNYMGAFSIPFRLLTTNNFGFLQFVFGEYKFSPLVFPYPLFAGYWDGI